MLHRYKQIDSATVGGSAGFLHWVSNGLSTLYKAGPIKQQSNHHNASNNPPAAIIGATKAGAVITGCASPELILVEAPTPVATPAVMISQEVLVVSPFVTGVG